MIARIPAHPIASAPTAGEREVEETLYVGGIALPHGGEEQESGLLMALARLPGLRWYAERIAPRRLRLERVAVPLAALPAGLAGLRIGFLTDIHHDPDWPLALLERGIALLQAAEPDLILLGGDYVVDRADGFAPCAALLGRLRAPLGVYAILGNHDYRPGGEALAAQLAAAGPVLLRNEAVRLGAPDDDPLWVVGLDDALRGQPDFAAASARVPAGEFALLLAHEPDIADQLNSDRVGLQLSGHTHGGQVVLPGFGPPLLPALGRRYLRGLRHDAGHPVYTSRGLGAVPPYLRFNCPPEVTLLTLARA